MAATLKVLKKLFLVLGYVLFACASLSLVYSIHTIWHRWTIFERPVRVENGYSFTQGFTVGFPNTYELAIECRKTIPFNILNSILMDQFEDVYSVTTGGLLVADNNSPKQFGASWENDRISRVIGRFRAEPGKVYQINVRFTRSFPELKPTNPTAILRVDGPTVSDAFEATLIFVLLAVLLALAGWLCVIPTYWSFWTRLPWRRA